MILRARLKPIEEIPPEAICCEKTRKAYQRNGGHVTTVLSGTSPQAYCRSCGAIACGVQLAATNSHKAIDPRAWDIEESPEETV